MSNFDELYQEIILDHYRNPRNFKDLSYVSNENVHENPTCGDSLKIDIEVEDEKVKAVFFDGKGCAISMASASILTELLEDKTIEKARELINQFLSILRGEVSVDELENMGDAACFKGLVDFPVRIKCASLAWHGCEENLKKIK